jgi:TctA family transporter
MSDLVSPLLVAAITGVTYVAYKHHDAYKNIDKWLGRAFLAYVLILIGFTLGAATAGLMAKPYMEPNADAKLLLVQAEFRRFIDSITLPVLAVFLYSWFLTFLPKMLGLKKKNTDDVRDDEDS